MKLAQNNNSATVPMYTQHMRQAAILWSQLITQMIDLADEQSTGAATDSDIEEQQLSMPKYSHWQQQL